MAPLIVTNRAGQGSAAAAIRATRGTELSPAPAIRALRGTGLGRAGHPRTAPRGKGAGQQNRLRAWEREAAVRGAPWLAAASGRGASFRRLPANPGG